MNRGRDVLTARCASPNRLLPPTPLVLAGVRFPWDLQGKVRIGRRGVVTEAHLRLEIPGVRYDHLWS